MYFWEIFNQGAECLLLYHQHLKSKAKTSRDWKTCLVLRKQIIICKNLLFSSKYLSNPTSHWPVDKRGPAPNINFFPAPGLTEGALGNGCSVLKLFQLLNGDSSFSQHAYSIYKVRKPRMTKFKVLQISRIFLKVCRSYSW